MTSLKPSNKVYRNKAYRTTVAASLALPLMFGCASAPTSPTGNQEERIQKTLTGTWSGYIKDHPWVRIGNNDVTLEIYNVRKKQDGWTINANVNWQSPEYVKLNIYNDEVTIEVMDRYGGLFTLAPFRDTHLLGKVGYDRGKWPTKNEVILKKISPR
ncbi:MAG: hypothetical protein HYU56_02120 [Candidatus Aenigmarchaeota archaeon]|nr:hypothetical protein [Candidatus Aenigmarchaeota archaeon]